MRTVQNLLVTGGCGFIGSAFIRYLLQRERHYDGICVNLDLLSYAGHQDNCKDIEMDPRYRFHKGDICNQSFVEHLCSEHEIDTIIHFAAESHVDRSIDHPQAFLDSNIVGTFKLLEVVKKNPHIHFHHVSTDEVFGSLGDKGSFTEESAYRPNSPYSATKAAADHLVRAYAHTFGISTCISNSSNNYGPFQYPEKLIPLIILNCLQEQPLPIYGDGTNVRDWLYVDDHASALWMLLKHGVSGESYNIGGETELCNLDVVKAIIDQVSKQQGLPPEHYQKLITFVKDRPGHDYRYAINCNKIKQEIGWRPLHQFSLGMEKTVQWYIDNISWLGKKHVSDQVMCVQ